MFGVALALAISLSGSSDSTCYASLGGSGNGSPAKDAAGVAGLPWAGPGPANGDSLLQLFVGVHRMLEITTEGAGPTKWAAWATIALDEPTRAEPTVLRGTITRTEIGPVVGKRRVVPRPTGRELRLTLRRPDTLEFREEGYHGTDDVGRLFWVHIIQRDGLVYGRWWGFAATARPFRFGRITIRESDHSNGYFCIWLPADGTPR